MAVPSFSPVSPNSVETDKIDPETGGPIYDHFNYVNRICKLVP